MPREGFAKSNNSSAAAGFIRVKNLKKNQEISGVYLGSYLDTKYSLPEKPKFNYRIELASATTLPTQATKKDPVVNQKFKAGDVVVINGAGNLPKLLSTVDAGTDLDIVYTGTSMIKSGQFKGTDSHTFEIYTDASVQVPAKVKAAPSATANSADDDDIDF